MSTHPCHGIGRLTHKRPKFFISQVHSFKKILPIFIGIICAKVFLCNPFIYGSCISMNLGDLDKPGLYFPRVSQTPCRTRENRACNTPLGLKVLKTNSVMVLSWTFFCLRTWLIGTAPRYQEESKICSKRSCTVVIFYQKTSRFLRHQLFQAVTTYVSHLNFLKIVSVTS